MWEEQHPKEQGGLGRSKAGETKSLAGKAYGKKWLSP